MKYKKTNFHKHESSERGFSIIELFVALAVVAIVTTITLVGVTRARSATEFSNTTRTFQSYFERAVMDAKRRHALGSDRSKVEVIDTKTYKVSADFDQNGNVESKTVTLPTGVSFEFPSGSPPKATIDWRGDIAEGSVAFKFKTSTGTVSEVKITNKGDVRIGTELPTLPTETSTPTSADVKTASALNGNAAANPDPSPTPTPTPVPYCTGNQKPEVDNCRCKAGQVLDRGKCK